KLSLDDALLSGIKEGYINDPFVQKLTLASIGMDSIQSENGFWFINNRLVIP
ncbi:hypothetical protein BYT27DRAFT_7008518, partial [Phlegmacium glaucopus]